MNLVNVRSRVGIAGGNAEVKFWVQSEFAGVIGGYISSSSIGYGD